MSFTYFLTLCMRAVKALTRLCRSEVRLIRLLEQNRRCGLLEWLPCHFDEKKLVDFFFFFFFFFLGGGGDCMGFGATFLAAE